MKSTIEQALRSETLQSSAVQIVDVSLGRIAKARTNSAECMVNDEIVGNLRESEAATPKVVLLPARGTRLTY